MLRDVGKFFSGPRVMPDARAERSRSMIRHLLVAALFFSALFGMGGCSGEVTVDQKFVNLFVELRIVENTYGKDSPTARLLRHETLKAAGYTSEEFLAKTDEILNDERQWVPFQKAVNARIDSLLQQPAPSPEKEEERKGKAPTPPIKKKPPLMPAHKGGVP